MVSFPNAKINLGLSILEKLPDGFHSIESVFYPVQWVDAIEILPSPTLTFRSSGISIPGDKEDNLCLKVYKALSKDYDVFPVLIHLRKNIPIGAGMGGGSSDAAFTLKALNDLFHLDLTTSQMEAYMRPLGSDCAFFIQNKQVIAYGKGDQFKPTNLSLAGKNIVVIYPSIHIATKEAYSGVKPGKPEISIETIVQQPISTWKGVLKNDFEDSVFPKYPVLKEIKETLYNNGALYASMTGSGSAIYGIFNQAIDPTNIFPSDYICWKGILS